MKEIIIPLFAITARFVMPAVIGLVAVISWFKSRNRLYGTIDDAIDKGAPPEVINKLLAMTESKESKEPQSSKRKELSEGAIALGVGVAFLILYYLVGNRGMACGNRTENLPECN